jgi:manganese/iron transport system substrate-binding protein
MLEVTVYKSRIGWNMSFRKMIGIVILIMLLGSPAMTSCALSPSISTSSVDGEYVPARAGDAAAMPLLSEPQKLPPANLGEGEKLNVVVTTTIVADVVSHIGGDVIELTTLLPFEVDPHVYEPTPKDYQAVAEANVVFINGFGLEVFMGYILEQIADEVAIISLSEGIEVLQFSAGESDANEHDGGETHAGEEGGVDPHVWFDPFSIMVWVENASQAMGALDPVHAELYDANAREYKRQLEMLDQWIEEQVDQVAEDDRLLVTDHLIFGYFARRYGFQMVGALIPAYSTAAQPSAQEIANLEDAIRGRQVKAVFVGPMANRRLIDRVAEDTGVKVVSLYTGSLSEADLPAGTYLDFMKYNVGEIVQAFVE